MRLNRQELALLDAMVNSLDRGGSTWRWCFARMADHVNGLGLLDEEIAKLYHSWASVHRQIIGSINLSRAIDPTAREGNVRHAAIQARRECGL